MSRPRIRLTARDRRVRNRKYRRAVEAHARATSSLYEAMRDASPAELQAFRAAVGPPPVRVVASSALLVAWHEVGQAASSMHPSRRCLW